MHVAAARSFSGGVVIVIYRVFQKSGPLVYFDDNFGKYGPILTIFSLLQQEINDTQKLSHFSHLTLIMLPLYLMKQTLILVSVFYMFVLMKLMVHISQT